LKKPPTCLAAPVFAYPGFQILLMLSKNVSACSLGPY